VCDGDRATLCNADGSAYLSDGEECSSEQVCLLGSCEDLECTPSTSFCSGNVVRDCDESGLSSEEAKVCGSGEYCDVASATCKTGVCAPGQPACDGNRATTCNSVGGGYVAGGTICASNETCDAGECKPQVCVPDDIFCQGQTVKTCSENGLSSSVTDTCAAQTCVKSGSSASCQGDCGPTQRRCSGNRPQLCDVTGAYANDGSACSANGTCNTSTTACQCSSGYSGNGVTCIACVAGTYSVVGAASCTACAVGTYSASGASSCTPCAGGSWDHDANPATACRTCVACSAATGTYESAACSATTNRLCKAFPSCEGLAANCGSNDNCCASPTVAGGIFTMGTSTAGTIATFALDKYEVTVGRFRKFVAAYSGAPDSGAGAHPLVSGSGWQSSWDSSIAANSANLMANVGACDPLRTWRDTASTTESLPLNCVTWYEAFAFCAWDRGRLPTEAEWEYAAKGGSENRTYAWGSTPAPSSTYAVYNCNGNGDASSCSFEDIVAVGSRPSGVGKYGQLDLMGSMFEWTLDSSATPLPATCNNCARVISGDRIFRGGTWSFGGDPFLTSARRDNESPTARGDVFGFRCARTP
jgi:formylglycine-generating enzyme